MIPKDGRVVGQSSGSYSKEIKKSLHSYALLRSARFFDHSSGVVEKLNYKKYLKNRHGENLQKLVSGTSRIRREESTLNLRERG